MKYSDIRHTLSTGDIVLFSGTGMISTVIKWATRSPWSHVGMIVVADDLDMLILWESTTLSKVKDVRSDTVKQGVQVVALSERINSYDGKVAVRKLEGACVGAGRMKELQKFRAEVKDRTYEESKIELAKSAYDGPFGHNEEDLSSLFCSELIAEGYQRMGLLSETISSNEYTPANFGNMIKLQEGWLGDIIELEVG